MLWQCKIIGDSFVCAKRGRTVVKRAAGSATGMEENVTERKIGLVTGQEDTEQSATLKLQTKAAKV